MSTLVVQHAAHRAGDRITPDCRHGGKRCTPEASHLSFSSELGDAEERESRPVGHDVEVVGEGHRPSLALRPRGRKRDGPATRARDHRSAQPRGGPRDDGIGGKTGLDYFVLA